MKNNHIRNRDAVALMRCYAVAIENKQNINKETLEYICREALRTINSINFFNADVDEKVKIEANQVYSGFSREVDKILKITH